MIPADKRAPRSNRPNARETHHSVSGEQSATVPASVPGEGSTCFDREICAGGVALCGDGRPAPTSWPLIRLSATSRPCPCSAVARTLLNMAPRKLDTPAPQLGCGRAAARNMTLPCAGITPPSGPRTRCPSSRVIRPAATEEIRRRRAEIDSSYFVCGADVAGVLAPVVAKGEWTEIQPSRERVQPTGRLPPGRPMSLSCSSITDEEMADSVRVARWLA
jgi:hypothetical protein